MEKVSSGFVSEASLRAEVPETVTKESVKQVFDDQRFFDGCHVDDESGLTQVFRIGYTSSGMSDAVIIHPCAFMEDPEDLGARQRNAILSLVTQADVISIGMPGMDLGTDNLTKSQKEYLTGKAGCRKLGKSSFFKLGQAMSSALETGVQLRLGNHTGGKYFDNKRIIMDGYSMGSSAVAGMLPHLSFVPDVVLWRETADRMEETPFFKFTANYVKNGGTKMDVYHQMNTPLITGEDQNGFRHRMARLARFPLTKMVYLPLGMANSSIPGDLDRAEHRSRIILSTQHVVINGEQSLVSTTEQNDKFAKDILNRGLGLAVLRLTIKDATHAVAEDYLQNAGMIKKALAAVL